MTDERTIPPATGAAADGAVAAVHRWWRAMRDGDIPALAALLAEDYMVTGGPGGRTEGRAAVLAEARAFLAAARIDRWTLTGIRTRTGPGHAVCSYRWSERGVHAGAPFRLEGLATDVLMHDGEAWVHRARHVSMAAPGEGDGAGDT